MLCSLLDAFERLETPGGLPPVIVRDTLAALTAFLVALVFGRWFIRFQLGHRVLEAADKSDSARLAQMHRSKKNTPTMGGVIVIVATLAGALLWARLDSPALWLLAGALVGLGALGFLDDYTKLTVAGSKGLSARFKLGVQLCAGLAAGTFLYTFPLASDPDAMSGLFLPLGAGVVLPIGLLSIPLCALVVTGSSNAVNLTDGLDGLAMGCAVLVEVPLLVVALVAGHQGASGILSVPVVPAGPEISVFLAALLGAGLGFLWFNCHPARIFMGDTGALALGGVLGLAAVLLRQEVLFVIMGGVFVVEALSVILQVGSFKLRRKRVFLIAPLHHHYQFRGWSETKVTVRFWIAAAICSAASLVSFRWIG